MTFVVNILGLPYQLKHKHLINLNKMIYKLIHFLKYVDRLVDRPSYL